jgi:DnaB-like helicase N terminal domain/AAA domain
MKTLPQRRSRPPEIERPLPQNTDAERSVLGAILIDVNNKPLDVVRDILCSADFFDERNQKIFHAMLDMHQRQQRIDLVTLPEYLVQQHQLALIQGGPAYVSNLIDGVPHVTNVEHYARIVKEKSRLRSLIHMMHSIQQRALDAGEDADTIIGCVREHIDTLEPPNGLAGEPRGWREMFHSFPDFENAASLTFAIKGFLQNNGATLIGGLSGHGKTLLMLSVVRALLAGKGAKLWDYFDVMETAVRILYLIPECSIEPFKYRLKLFGLYDYLAPNDGRLLVRTLSKGPTPCLSDPRILYAAKGAHVFLDTAVRFSAEGDENSAGDNQRGLAADIFALLAAGARTVQGAHHAPKPFARENVMRLENVLRGSGDIGAMVSTAWGVKQIDAAQNIVHIENIKPRDFQPPQPFQLIGRPYIDQVGDFMLHKKPGDCGSLQDEQAPDRDRGGAPIEQREQRQQRIATVEDWLKEKRNLTRNDVVARFAAQGVTVSYDAAKKYLSGAKKGRV